MSPSTRNILMFLLLPLAVGVVFTQRRLDPMIREMHKGERTVFAGLSNEFILGPMLGLQEAVAGALWVRADEFFHEGDYDAILPIVRLVTWLDPHQVDVYITGAWHLAYNFTDIAERSDRRYIPAALALLREGDENNPTLYDVAFELGWETKDKVRHPEEAEPWFRIATQRSATDDQGRIVGPPPLFVMHQLAHSLEQEAKIDECIAVWRESLKRSAAELVLRPHDYGLNNTHQSEIHNLKLTLERRFSRYHHEVDWEVDSDQTKSVNMQTGEPSPPNAYLCTNPKEYGVPVGQPNLPAIHRHWDTAFDCKIFFPKPKDLQIRGQFNVGDGARVNITLHDSDWHPTQLHQFTFDVDQTRTIMMDQHAVRLGQWGREIDMSRDPKIYSFTRDKYYLVFDFNPRLTSPHIQDLFGWSGEGMYDKKYLWIDQDKSINPPLRMLRKVYLLTKSQIMGAEPVTDKNVISNDEYARVQRQAPAASNATP